MEMTVGQSAWHELARSLRASRGLRFGLWWQVALLAGSVAALPFDKRYILGLNPWIKPIKFELSVSIFLLTMAVLLYELGRDGSFGASRRWLGWGFAVCMVVENTIIALQSARGVRSHMNFSTPLDGALFAAMGIFVLLNTLLVAWLLVLWSTTRSELAPATLWGVRLGIMFLLAGSIEGVRIVTNAGHTVIAGHRNTLRDLQHATAQDGGPGLPFVNWSTLHGDLRVAHFFALHALQILPLMGLALASTQLGSRTQVALVWIFAAGYAGAVWWLFTEAMGGVPLTAGL